MKDEGVMERRVITFKISSFVEIYLRRNLLKGLQFAVFFFYRHYYLVDDNVVFCLECGEIQIFPLLCELTDLRYLSLMVAYEHIYIHASYVLGHHSSS